MKELFEKLRSIFKIPELRERIIYTLILLAVFRLGSFVVIPGVDGETLEGLVAQGGEGLLGLLNNFVGGSFLRASVFSLGIMPYISASIIVQVMALAIPSLQRLRYEGESGQKKMNQVTRYITIAVTLVQASSAITYLRTMYPEAIIGGLNQTFFWITGVVIMTAGTMFLVWLGERITDNGIGNGSSLIIAVGIISRLPISLYNEYTANPIMTFFIEMIGLGIVTAIVIAITQATRKIPIHYARRTVGGRIPGGNMTQRQYLPIKMNTAGVMPIIFAQALMFLPATFLSFSENTAFYTTGSFFSNTDGFWYNLLFGVMIILFTYFYTAIIIQPNEMADMLKKNGGFIPGIKHGKETAEYIDQVVSRVTLPGSICLALIAILPAIASAFGVSSQFSQFYGGTSILIMIGVVLDTLQQIESYLLNRHYDGLMKSGRVRSGAAKVGATI